MLCFVAPKLKIYFFPLDSSLEAFAGSFVGESGYVDGPAAKSLFNRPQSLSICDNGAVFVADTRNLAIRKISKFLPTVTTIAGGSSRKPGFAGDTARFSSEFSLACSCGSLLIADCGNRLIREIQIDDPKSCDSSDSAVSGDFSSFTWIFFLSIGFKTPAFC
ncbi:hypothetical protein SELMODRAFT_135182 [Selaginella moellendorffii]|uniref:NHL repeat-containing protein n=1 Tax=Selaginella moellendorffii TaxID=88036 RepID=D8TA11_SELML|nr:hypothetical protein SELMODRAFT_135182 [Selaginella moellendorffii]